MNTCDTCDRRIRENGECDSCFLYNAAVAAVGAAAQQIARDYSYRARKAWMNEHGVFAWIGNKAVQIGTPEQAAPFIALIQATRRVSVFMPPLVTQMTSGHCLRPGLGCLLGLAADYGPCACACESCAKTYGAGSVAAPNVDGK